VLFREVSAFSSSSTVGDGHILCAKKMCCKYVFIRSQLLLSATALGWQTSTSTREDASVNILDFFISLVLFVRIGVPCHGNSSPIEMKAPILGESFSLQERIHLQKIRFCRKKTPVKNRTILERFKRVEEFLKIHMYIYIYIYIWVFPKNRGTPKWMVF